MFEGWVVSLLRAYRDYRGLFDDWAYWAPGKGSDIEVDLLLRRGRSTLALEIKASRNIPERGLRGLRAIADLPGVRRRVVVCLCDRESRTYDGIEILPLSKFLRLLQEGTLF